MFLRSLLSGSLAVLVCSAVCPATCSVLSHNQRCDKPCNIPACQFDSRECIPACPAACSSAQIGDGVCHPLCNNADCLSDNGDCTGKCNEGCFLTMLGDGVCQPQCNNIWCEYDRGECACVPALLGNGICDSICQSADFDFDAGDCAEFIFVNATEPSEAGSGSRSDPYRSFSKALMHPFTNTQAGLCFLPGPHIMSRPEAQLVWFVANVTHLFVTCQYCSDCSGEAELRIVDSEPQLFYGDNLTAVLFAGIRIDGLQRLMRGCRAEYCAFCLDWTCGNDTCVSTFGYSVPSSQVPTVCAELPCSKLKAVVLLFNATSAAIRDVTMVNIGGVESLIVVNSSHATLRDIVISNVEVTSHAVQIIGQNLNATINTRVFSVTHRNYVLLSPFEGYLSAQVHNLTVRNVNVFQGSNFCMAFMRVAGALSVADVHEANVTGVKVERLFDFLEDDYSSLNTGVVSMLGVEKTVLRDCTFVRVFARSGGLVFAYLPANLRDLNSLNVDAANITIEDSLFRAGSAVTVTSAVGRFNPNARVENVTVLRTTGTAFHLEQHSEAGECTTFFISSRGDEANQPRSSSIANLRLVEISPLTAAAIAFSDACNVLIRNVTLTESREDVSPVLAKEMSSFLISLASALLRQTGLSSASDEQAALSSVLWCSGGLVAVQQVDNVTFTELIVSHSRCSNAAIASIVSSSNVALQGISFSNNSAVKFEIIAIEDGGSLSLRDFAFVENEVDSGVVAIARPTLVQIINGNFVRNTAIQAAGLLVDSARTELRNVTFDSLTAEEGGAIVARTTFASVVLSIADSAFSNASAKRARDILITDDSASGTDVRITRSVFQGGNEASSIAVEPGTRVKALHFETVQFISCRAADFMGAITLQFSHGVAVFSNVAWVDCVNSDAEIGSVLYIDIAPDSSIDRTYVSMDSCKFLRNAAAVLISLPNEHVRQSMGIANSRFEGNRGRLFDLVHANVDAFNCEMRRNSHSGVVLVRMLFGSLFSLRSSLVAGNSPATNLFSASEFSFLALEDVTLSENSVTWSLLTVASSSLTASNATFAYNHVLEGPIALVQTSELVMKSVSLHNNFPNRNMLDVQMSNFSASDFRVEDENTNILLLRKVSASLTEVQVESTAATFATIEESSVSVSDLEASFVQGSLFRITASSFEATALRLINCSSVFEANESRLQLSMSWIERMAASSTLESSVISLNNSQFLRNAGCVSAKNSSLTIVDSRFESTVGDSALRAVDSVITAEGVVFRDNSAEEGAALHLRCPSANCNYTFRSMTFRENRAIRGAATFYIDVKPVFIDVEMYDNLAQYGSLLGTIPQRLVNISNFPVAVSGADYSFPTFELRDELGQVMTADNSSAVQLAVPDGTTMQGNSRTVARKGVFAFSGIRLTSVPGNIIEIRVSSESVPDLVVSVLFRLCGVGEVLEPDNSCHRCEAMTYSFTEKDNSCSPCPVGALCYGGAEVFPLPGFWRSSNTSDIFYECGKPCLGSPQKRNALGECAEGYFSNLCSACESQYFRFSATSCKPCPKRSVNIIVSMVLFVVYVAFLAKIVSGSISQAEKSKTSLHLKLVMNYLQVTMMLSEFNLQWPDVMLDIFHTSTVAGNSSQAFFAIDCFSDLGPEPFIYVKHVTISLMPLVQICLSCGLWTVVAVARSDWKYLRDHNISTVMTLLLLLHSTLTSSVLSLFACRGLDNGTWLVEDPSVRCWTKQHTFFVLALGLPSLIVWVVGFPLAVLAVLVGSHRDSPQSKLRYGFLYSGYQSRLFFWEAIVIARKVAVKAVSVVLSHAQDIHRVMAANSVIVTVLALQVAYRPYEDLRINHVEALSMTANFVTLTLGAYFSSNTSFAVQQGLIWGIVAVNCVFLSYWARSLTRASQVCLRLRRRRRVTTELDLSQNGCQDDSSVL